MILVADSGSTKTDWVLKPEYSSPDASGPTLIHTQGINPIHMADAQILTILRDELLSALPPHLSSLTIAFYGSGVRADQEERMERLLREAFSPLIAQGALPPVSTEGDARPVQESALLHVEAHSDLLGAARALCGDREGLACILGTGANSCLYDGQHIVANTPPLGYILGDEGSGAVLGKRFLNALYKGRLSRETQDAFETTVQATLTEVIDRVYRQPMANRWLASLSPFIHSRLADPAVEQLAVDNFSDFISRNIDPYHRHDLPLQAVGSIAYHYREQLCKAATKAGYAVGNILRSPLDNQNWK